MALNVDIEKLSAEAVADALGQTPNNGYGHNGIIISPDAKVSWSCPMCGDGGETNDLGVLAVLLARYYNEDEFDAENGPDEILWKSDGEYYFATISLA